MTTDPYVPQPGSVPARVVKYLSSRPGEWVPTSDIIDATGIKAPSVLTSCDSAISAGWIVRQQREARRWFWKLGPQAPGGDRKPEEQLVSAWRAPAPKTGTMLGQLGGPPPVSGDFDDVEGDRIDAPPFDGVEDAQIAAAAEATVAALEEAVVEQAGEPANFRALTLDELERMHAAAVERLQADLTLPPTPGCSGATLAPDDDPDFREVPSVLAREAGMGPIDFILTFPERDEPEPTISLAAGVTEAPREVVGRRASDILMQQEPLRYAFWNDGTFVLCRGEVQISMPAAEALALRKFLFKVPGGEVGASC